jgi:glycosyltransferase involved in cell wall biosynthesis
MPAPLVSVCVPVLNERDLVCEAIDSALGQDHPNIEIVVVDDGSTDGTPDVLRERYGDRIRLLVNPSQAGQARATSRCIRHSHGAFVKFLDHDDTLQPNSVSQLVEALLGHPSAGMAFGRRRVSIDPDSPDGLEWLERFGEVHKGFSSLQTLNPGSKLFEEMLANELRENWVGEPTSVMVRRTCLERLGGLHLYVQATVDLDLWLRVMAHFDVAFVDERLSTFRRRADSLTDRARGEKLNWLDRLWTLEGLMSYRDLPEAYPQLARMRSAERRMAFRTAANKVRHPRSDAPPLRLYRRYLAYRARDPLGKPRLFGRINHAT